MVKCILVPLALCAIIVQTSEASLAIMKGSESSSFITTPTTTNNNNNVAKGSESSTSITTTTTINNNNNVAFIQTSYVNDTSSLSNIASAVVTHGGTAFNVLSMMIYTSAYSPSTANPLPLPDPAALSFLQQAAENSSSKLRIWGGVSLCPGPEYACMLNYSQSAETGLQLFEMAAANKLDGIQIYVSPFCNNADCKKTTGKYAEGIATIINAFRAASNDTLDIALLLNEWDNCQIVADAKPTAIFSYQTVFYFTSISDCQKDCGVLCGAGENVAYIEKAKVNFTTDVMEYLVQHDIKWVGMLDGGSTPEATNPPDFWSGLSGYMKGNFTF